MNKKDYAWFDPAWPDLNEKASVVLDTKTGELYLIPSDSMKIAAMVFLEDRGFEFLGIL